MPPCSDSISRSRNSYFISITTDSRLCINGGKPRKRFHAICSARDEQAAAKASGRARPGRAGPAYRRLAVLSKPSNLILYHNTMGAIRSGRARRQQPIAGGGWVATFDDSTDQRRAGRSNPRPGRQRPQISAGEKCLGVKREQMIGKMEN